MESKKTIKQIEANLKLNASSEEIIEVLMNGNTYSLYFTKEDQSYLRDFFKECIEELLKEPFEFVLKKDEAVKNEIIIKVSQEYIQELNKELASCIAEITKDVNEQ